MPMQTDALPNGASTSEQPNANMFAANGGPFMGVSIPVNDIEPLSYDV